jgi:hypothetical protein
MNTSSTTIYRWCLKAEWPEHLLNRMAEYLGVNVEWLKTGRGAKFAGGVLADGTLDKHLEHLHDRMMYDIGRIMKHYTREVYAAIRNPEATFRAPNQRLSDVPE